MLKRIVFITSALLFITTVFLAYHSLKLSNELVTMQNHATEMEDRFQVAQSENELFQTINKSMEFQMSGMLSNRDQEREEFAEALELERLKVYIEETKNEDSDEEEEVAGYFMWESANEVAALLYEDSDGRFEKNWGRFLAIEAMNKDIDPFIVYELLRVETGGKFDPDAVGPQTRYGRAYGMAQFMENTAPWIAEMADLPYDFEFLFDPLYSIQLAVTYLDFLFKQYGDWDHALTAYHRGIYGMQNYVERNGNAKSWYAVEIQENAGMTGDEIVASLPIE